MLISIGGLALTHPDDRKQAALEKAKQTKKIMKIVTFYRYLKTAYLYSICSLVQYFIA